MILFYFIFNFVWVGSAFYLFNFILSLSSLFNLFYFTLCHYFLLFCVSTILFICVSLGLHLVVQHFGKPALSLRHSSKLTYEALPASLVDVVWTGVRKLKGRSKKKSTLKKADSRWIRHSVVKLFLTRKLIIFPPGDSEGMSVSSVVAKGKFN